MRYRSLTAVLGLTLLSCLCACAQEQGPVATWTFNDNLRRIVFSAD